MNDPAMHNDNGSAASYPHPNNNVAADRSAGSSDDLLGAVDIVEAFTGLRQELKLQVRSGREMQQTLSEGLLRIEKQLAAVPTLINAGGSDSRKLAEALADIDESLRRAIDSLTLNATSQKKAPGLVHEFDSLVARAPWFVKKFAVEFIQQTRGLFETAENERTAQEQSTSTVIQGFELLMVRVGRQMQQCEMERLDVLGHAFDAEFMNAIDVIESPSIPSSHVAVQLRPAYLWCGNLLRFAEVRLAK